MQRISFDRSELPQASVVFIATLAALALLAWVLAYWSWIWLLPRPESRADDPPPPVAGSASPVKLFGAVQRATGGAPATGLALKLQGVVASAADRRGYAVLQLDAKRVLAVPAGEEVAPGVRLVEVHADHVILERGGMRETLAWPPKNVAAAPALANK